MPMLKLNNSFTRLQSRRRWNLINKSIFYFFLGNIFTALIYYIAIYTGKITITYF